MGVAGRSARGVPDSEAAADRAPVGATSAPPCSCSSPRSRATATASCRRSRSRSEGVWRPSPGSVYPALQQLEDEGLIRAEERDGSRVFTLTDDGTKHVEENDLGAPWEAVRDDMGEGLHELRGLLTQVGTAAWQVAQAGTEAQVAEARRILGDTRRALYRILAEDGEETKDGDAQ